MIVREGVDTALIHSPDDFLNGNSTEKCKMSENELVCVTFPEVFKRTKLKKG